MFLFVSLFCLAKESRREMDVLAASNASLATNDRTSLVMTTRANSQAGGANSSTYADTTSIIIEKSQNYFGKCRKDPLS
jgi:hypothetical protein